MSRNKDWNQVIFNLTGYKLEIWYHTGGWYTIERSFLLEKYVNIDNDDELSKVIKSIMRWENIEWYTEIKWTLFTVFSDWWMWEVTYPVVDFSLEWDISLKSIQFKFEEI